MLAGVANEGRTGCSSSVFVAVLLVSASALITPPRVVRAQDAGRSDAGHLSEPHHELWAPEVFRTSGRQPSWTHGYLAQFTGDVTPGNPNAYVYDRQGKVASQARFCFPSVVRITLLDAIATAEGGAIASGNAETDEGETFSFLAKTDSSGVLISSLETQKFIGRVCEASDGTIWTYGYAATKESENDHNYYLVEQYSFEKGLLNSYLSRELVAVRKFAITAGGGGPNGTFLVCSKDRISLYMNQTNECVEIEPSTQKLQRWKMDMAPLERAAVTGLAVTEDGHVYASLYEVNGTTQMKTHGLYELRAEHGKASASWAPVAGTLNAHREGEVVPKDAFYRLWGAEGNDLIIGRQNAAEFSWVKVIH
jgi:hypothetical protein